jgi:hypothetical protein
VIERESFSSPKTTSVLNMRAFRKVLSTVRGVRATTASRPQPFTDGRGEGVTS